MEALLERDAELRRLAAALDRAKRGRGGLVVVEGGLGTGKTSLLRAGIANADAAGFEVLQARGTELETDFGFGVVRQLFERPLHAASPRRREQLLNGAAALAAPMLGLAPGPPGDDPFVGLHGIYWLVAQMADERPLVLVVDDAHWADPDSLRSLSYVANRLHDLPVVLLLGVRVVAGETPLAQLPVPADDIELAALGEASVAELVRTRLGRDGDGDFVAACHRVTAGNPLALAELLRELADNGVAPTAEAAAKLEDRPPPRLARGIVARVQRAGRPAEQLAQALAVLGGGVALSLAAELAELQPGVAAQALVALATAGVLVPDGSSAFAHPLIRSAVYEQIPPAARSQAHRRAADLVAQGGDPDAAAVHLLAVDPAGDVEVVQLLAAAAGHALEVGAPEASARYLQRALREPPPPELGATLLGQLGAAEVAKGDPASIDHLEQAQRATTDPQQRAAFAAMRGAAMTYLGASEAAIETARQELAELDAPESPLALRLEASAAALMWQDARWAEQFEAVLPDLLRLAERGGEHGRGLALTLSAALAGRGETERALHLVDVGLDDGAFLAGESVSGIELPQAMNGLIWAEQSDRVVGLGQDVLAESRRRGSVFGAIAGGIQLGLARWRRGELAEAEAQLSHADALAAAHGAVPPHIFSQAYLAYVRVARGHLDEVGDGSEPLPDAAVTSALLTAQHARAAVRLARGDRAGAIADLRAVGELLEQIRMFSPGVIGWRAELAELLAQDDPEEARALAEEGLRRARAAGLDVAAGVALRALAASETGTARIELLEQSVAALEPNHARLEYARSLTGLGVALRDSGKPRDARPLLAAALDQAHRCGAQPLAQRARAEAVAAGARPRRPRLTGVEALTPSELRVARLASEGLSNREIAQALFVTTKTVADHLAASYRKLGIRRREGLPKALAEPTPSG